MSKLVRADHWRSASWRKPTFQDKIDIVLYWARGIEYRIGRQTVKIIACVALVMASVSMVWAPNESVVTRVEIVRDTIVKNGIVIQTDTIVQTIAGPTRFIYKSTKVENEAAPFVPDEPNAKAYISKYASTAVQGMKKYGVPASISLAQGLIESRAGTSKLAVNNNNHFGIKCFSRSCKKGHCTNFTDDTHKDFFRKFKSPTESWNAHSQLLTSGRYTKLKKHGRDYRKWAYGLQSCGYATDKTYATKLIAVIKRHNLHRYDH